MNGRKVAFAMVIVGLAGAASSLLATEQAAHPDGSSGPCANMVNIAQEDGGGYTFQHSGSGGGTPGDGWAIWSYMMNRHNGDESGWYPDLAENWANHDWCTQ